MSSRRGKPRVRRKGSRNTGTYLQWIDHIVNASKTCTVVVAHKSDADVLKRLGVQHVYYVQEPYFKFLDAIAGMKRDCILLFDATHAGNVACERVKSDLQKMGVAVNTRFRKLLFVSANKELGGFLKFLHAQVMGTERKDAVGPPHGLP